MKDGHCSICNSSEVYANPAVKFYGSNNKVYLMEDNRDPSADVSAHFIPYICMSCGFTAMYVDDLNNLKDLPKKKGWAKAAK